MDILRKCRKCPTTANTLEELEYFVKDSSKLYGRSTICKICDGERKHKNYYENHEESKKRHREYSDTPQSRNRRTEYYLNKLYGITLADYDNMLEEQEGMCGICKTETPGGSGSRFHVDHNHDTGEVRGLLCANCNLGLGKFKDSKDFLTKAIEYLDTNGSYEKGQCTTCCEEVR